MGPADMDEPDPGDGEIPADAGQPSGDAAGSPASAADSPAGDSGTAEPAPAASAQPGGDQPGGAQPGVPAPDSPAPRHPGRKKKILAWTAGGLAVVLLAALGGAYAVYRHLNANLHQVDISGDLGTQPVDLHPQAENIVIIGSDSRNKQGKGFGQDLVTDQSDTLMIMHIAADRKWVNVMSIPRDSWVNIPACKMGNGQMSAPTSFKINEAFALGNLYGNHTDLGVACTVKTLEQDTGIHIDHFVVINFEGFRSMVNALGGVEVCNTTRIADPKSGLYLKPGHHLLHGLGALAYVRARYTLGDGSDLERIGRQQAFMSSLVERVKSELLDPLAIYRFLDAATKSVTIDSQLGGIHGLYDLAMSVRNLPASQVTFFTLPTYPRSEVVPTDTANVLWTQPEDSAIFQDFVNNTQVRTATLKPGQGPEDLRAQRLGRRAQRHHAVRAAGHRGRDPAAEGLPRDRGDPGHRHRRDRDRDQVPRGQPRSGQAAGGQGIRGHHRAGARHQLPADPGAGQRLQHHDPDHELGSARADALADVVRAHRQPEHLRQLTPGWAVHMLSSTVSTCFSAVSRSAACSPKKIRSARLPAQSAGSSSAGSRGSR